jgi:hypothetical protein
MAKLDFQATGSFGHVENGVLHGEPSREARQSLEGFSQIRRTQDKVHRRRVMEATRLYADSLQGRIDPIFIKEAMFPKTECIVRELQERYPGIYGDAGGRRLMGLRETMSVTDYQALFVDVLDRMYYGFYSGWPIVNKGLVRIHQLRDFRLVSRYLLDGVVTPLTAMDPAAPPPQRALVGPSPQDGTYPSSNTAPIQYQPLLYQAMTSVNWRAFVNDDLGIFRDLANRLSIAGNRGISKFITGIYCSSTGPNPNLYSAGYRNLITPTYGASSTNPSLSAQGIMDALKVLALQRDSGGDPILITGKLRLWYGPRYVAVAENLMSSGSLNVSVEGGTENAQGFPSQWLQVNNWLIRNMELVMDPYIPIVCTTSGVQDTMWGITVDPDSQNRPNSEVGFLQGYEVPQLFTKVPNTQRMGGGVDAMLGDFNTMDQDMKIVTVFGGTNIDGRSTVASTGQGQ